jgi:hypothetical protein
MCGDVKEVCRVEVEKTTRVAMEEQRRKQHSFTVAVHNHLCEGEEGERERDGWL